MEEEDTQLSIDEFIDNMQTRMVTLVEWLMGKKQNCSQCGARLLWCVDGDKNDYPMDLNGNNHFYACEKMDEWEN